MWQKQMYPGKQEAVISFHSVAVVLLSCYMLSSAKQTKKKRDNLILKIAVIEAIKYRKI